MLEEILPLVTCQCFGRELRATGRLIIRRRRRNKFRDRSGSHKVNKHFLFFLQFLDVNSETSYCVSPTAVVLLAFVQHSLMNSSKLSILTQRRRHCRSPLYAILSLQRKPLLPQKISPPHFLDRPRGTNLRGPMKEKDFSCFRRFLRETCFWHVRRFPALVLSKLEQNEILLNVKVNGTNGNVSIIVKRASSSQSAVFNNRYCVILSVEFFYAELPVLCATPACQWGQRRTSRRIHGKFLCMLKIRMSRQD